MKTSKFKMTEVGPIPKDWEVKRLGDVVETSSGGTPSRARPDFFQGTIKWFTTTELLDNKLYDSLEHISHEALKNSSAKIFPPKTLLMAMYGATIGRLGILQNHASTNQACCAIFCGDTLFSDYAYYYLYHLRQNIIERGCGAGQSNISQEIVRSLPVVLPPLAEQQRIAEALSDVDELISALGKLIEKKRNIKTGTMQELLTGKTRLPRFKGKWEEKRLGDCGFCFNGLTGKSGSDFGHGKACYITFLNVLTNVVIDSSIFEPVDICSGENQNEVRRGDIFFNTSSETPEEVGLCAVLEEDVKSVYLNSFCFGFRITDNDVSGRFLAYWFRASAGRALMTSLAQGSTRYNLSKDAFREACVCIPPTLAEQKAIAAVLSDMDAEIAALEADRAKYERIKSGMMQELLTGKTRLEA